MSPERPPVGIALVALITAVYGVGYAVHLGLVSSAFCLVLAVSLWKRTFLGLVGGFVLYGLQAVNGVILTGLQGPEPLPATIVVSVVVGYLLLRREAFDQAKILGSPTPASMPGDR